MSRFSNALQIILDEAGLSRAAVAERTGIPPATLHSYYYGKSQPDVAVLEKLCGIFDRKERATLVIEHLRDEIPPNAEDLVQVISLIDAPERVSEQSSPRPIQLPPKVREDFEFLMRKAMDSSVVVDSIRSTVRILRGE